MAGNDSDGSRPPTPQSLHRSNAGDEQSSVKGVGRIVYYDAMDMILLVAVNTTGAHVAKYGEAANSFEEVRKLCAADPAYSRCLGLAKKSVWDRYKKIMSEFLTKEIENRDASGINEEVTEKDNLLAEICEHIEDARLEQEKGIARKRKHDQDLIISGEAVGNRAL
jgi:hypothetical protein